MFSLKIAQMNETKTKLNETFSQSRQQLTVYKYLKQVKRINQNSNNKKLNKLVVDVIGLRRNHDIWNIITILIG